LKRHHFSGVRKRSAKIFAAGSNIGSSLSDIFANLYKDFRLQTYSFKIVFAYLATTWNRIAAAKAVEWSVK